MDRQSFFNRDFYPTPDDVIMKMLCVSDINGKIILEPSAGQGNIVDYLKANGAKQVVACELNDKLRKIVASKCDVIGDDFMQLQADRISHIDMIIMNPPFSQAAEHIIHAWEIAPDGCEIISLCNTNTIEYDRFSTKKRKVYELIRDYGGSENLGDVFKMAERETDVLVSVVRLYKPMKDNLEFADYFTNEADEPEMVGNGIIQYNFVRDCVNRYVAAVSKFDDVMAASKEINDLTNGIGGCSVKFGAHADRGDTITREFFKNDLQKSAWKWIFGKFHLEKFTTAKVMDEINKFVELQQNVPFTMKNIYKMVEMIVASSNDIMMQALNDAFDTICSFSADNSTAGEKWRTNSNYMVNRKFIMPNICSVGWGFRNYVGLTINYSHVRKIDDIVKVLCFLTGAIYEKMPDLHQFINENHLNWGEQYHWTFFKIRCYKKGTMHFEFVNEDVWYKFNTTVAKSRGWQLPQNVRTKKGGAK